MNLLDHLERVIRLGGHTEDMSCLLCLYFHHGCEIMTMLYTCRSNIMLLICDKNMQIPCNILDFYVEDCHWCVIVCTLHQSLLGCLGDQMKVNEMGGACSVHSVDEKSIHSFSQKT
jgi:hypothetical protein